ncbi:MAG: DUF3592 domain-containing protein [Gammaproteobacteria bacterium]|nr:DUF3592 domain-containing protein [Gammaproteobacteria bacterium]
MNYYVIILVMFSLTGVVLTVWGWRVMSQARQRKTWPTVSGEIVVSSREQGVIDLFPRIEYSYEIEGTTHQQLMEFPDGTQPTPEFCQAYLKKYPLGAAVTVYYQPGKPDVSTLEPSEEGDWMILALGILLTVFGTGFALSGN